VPLTKAQLQKNKTTTVQRTIVTTPAPTITRPAVPPPKAPTTTRTVLLLKINKGKTKQKVTQAALTKQVTRVKQLVQQKPVTKQKVTQLAKAKQLQKQLQSQLNQLRITQRALSQQLGRTPTVTGRVAALRLLIPPKFKKKKVKKAIVKKKKGKLSFDVFAKPVKGKKLIKVNKVPLSRIDARDLRNFIVDTSLSRTGSIKSRKKGKPVKSRLKAPKGYAKRTSFKFRRFRTKKGKRRPLAKGKVIEKRKKAS